MGELCFFFLCLVPFFCCQGVVGIAALQTFTQLLGSWPFVVIS